MNSEKCRTLKSRVAAIWPIAIVAMCTGCELGGGHQEFTISIDESDDIWVRPAVDGISEVEVSTITSEGHEVTVVFENEPGYHKLVAEPFTLSSLDLTDLISMPTGASELESEPFSLAALHHRVATWRCK